MKKHHSYTQAVLSGRPKIGKGEAGLVNPPVDRASTIIFGDQKTLEAQRTDQYENLIYGRYGTTITKHAEDAIAALEGGQECLLCPSGVAALTLMFMAMVHAGEHVLIPLPYYWHCGNIAELLKRNGAEYDFYHSQNLEDLKSKIKPNTKLIHMESPGSNTFEVQDIEAIVKIARQHKITTSIDNTYAAGVLCRPLEWGVDIVMQSLTKYVVGHADVVMGAVVFNKPHSKILHVTHEQLGYCVNADDCSLVLRSLRTLPLRLSQSGEGGMQVADWLKQQKKVAEIIHPGCKQDAYFKVYKKYFSGPNGLFGFSLNIDHTKVPAFINALHLIKTGFSWGGFESLILYQRPKDIEYEGREFDRSRPYFRLYIGLEHPDDLIADLNQALAKIK